MNCFFKSLPVIFTIFLLSIWAPLYATIVSIEINMLNPCHHISIVITDEQHPGHKERLDRWGGNGTMSAPEIINFSVDLDYDEVKKIYNDIKLGAGGSCCYENCADEVKLFFIHLLEKINEQTQADIAMEANHQCCTPFFCCLCFFPQLCCCTLPYSTFNRIADTVNKYPAYLKPVKERI